VVRQVNFTHSIDQITHEESQVALVENVSITQAPSVLPLHHPRVTAITLSPRIAVVHVTRHGRVFQECHFGASPLRDALQQLRNLTMLAR
jgi:hypothetical protein